MNGVHDMGGMHGMGPVELEKNEPVFHSEWEARVHALNLACGFHRRWNIDMGRHSRERIPPAEYLAATYYEKWLRGLETGPADAKAAGATRLGPPGGASSLPHRRLARLDDAGPRRSSPGARVLSRNDPPIGHTRLPGWNRGGTSSSSRARRRWRRKL